jgi:hypothetical protein
MRTSQELFKIAQLAVVLRAMRGDTEWSDEDRAAVSRALQELEGVGDAVHRYSKEDPQ